MQKEEVIESLPARGTNESRGATVIEYALLLALVLLVTITAVRALGRRTSSNFNTTASALGPQRVVPVDPDGPG